MPITELQLAPPADHNALLPKIAIASVLMILAGVAVFLLNPHREPVLTVHTVKVFSPHTEFKMTQGENKVIGETPTTEDDLYAIASVQVVDKLQIPISVDNVAATLTTADGSVVQATVVPPQELHRLESMFAQIAPLVASAPQPIVSGDPVAPAGTRTGSVLLLFPQVSAKDWQSKRSATLTLNLSHNLAPLTSAIP